jgi:drug/metabolite transporter (DMT)-like permease
MTHDDGERTGGSGAGKPGGRALAAEAGLLLTAAVWGAAFVAQRRGMEHVGPFLFNGLRFLLGCLPLLPFVWRARRAPGAGAALRRGVPLGILLFGGASLQQVGLLTTTVAKAGFITGLYVVFVPLMALVLGRRPSARVAGGALLAAAGLYFLTVGTGGDGVRPGLTVGDGLMLGCAVVWAAHILAVGRWAARLPWPQLALGQFLTCALLSLGVAAVSEPLAVQAIEAAGPALLYAGFVSVGVGYTLQVAAQRHAPPGPAAILLSLETVFAALAGWWWMDEGLSTTSLAGCALMLAGMSLASLRRGGD